MIEGMFCVSKTWHDEHWRSMYSVIVTGALGEPSTFPCWGMPFSSDTAVPESGSGVGVVVELDEPPVSATAAATAIPARTMTAPAIASTFGEAFRPPVLRTGGGGVRRCCRAFLPLVMSLPR